jgi:hypothetical protein
VTDGSYGQYGPDGPSYPSAKDTPLWMTDTPVEVDIDSVRSFGNFVRAEHDSNVVPNRETILNKLAGQHAYTWQDYAYSHVTPTTNPIASNRTVGVHDCPLNGNAQRLGLDHLEYEAAAMALLDSLTDGLKTIADGARLIADAYHTTEAQNAMDIDVVKTYFEGDPKNRSLHLPGTDGQNLPL